MLSEQLPLLMQAKRLVSSTHCSHLVRVRSCLLVSKPIEDDISEVRVVKTIPTASSTDQVDHLLWR